MQKDITTNSGEKVEIAKTIMQYILYTVAIFLLISIVGAIIFFFLFFTFGGCIYLKALKEEEAIYLLLQGRSEKDIITLDRHLSQSGLTPPTQAGNKYVSARSRGGRENNIRGGA